MNHTNSCRTVTQQMTKSKQLSTKVRDQRYFNTKLQHFCSNFNKCSTSKRRNSIKRHDISDAGCHSVRGDRWESDLRAGRGRDTEHRCGRWHSVVTGGRRTSLSRLPGPTASPVSPPPPTLTKVCPDTGSMLPLPMSRHPHPANPPCLPRHPSPSDPPTLPVCPANPVCLPRQPSPSARHPDLHPAVPLTHPLTSVLTLTLVRGSGRGGAAPSATEAGQTDRPRQLPLALRGGDGGGTADGAGDRTVP